jgi:hypothetical protein
LPLLVAAFFADMNGNLANHDKAKRPLSLLMNWQSMLSLQPVFTSA